MRQWVKRYQYVNLIGATADDVRDIMITGESGILAICPKDERPRYVANKRMLAWPNGAISLLFTAEEPDRFRGKQHMKLWLDELAAWRYGQESWDQASLGLRLGDRPQAVITTTPRPIKIIKDLIADPTTKVTRGSTYDNVANLADAFIKTIVKQKVLDAMEAVAGLMRGLDALVGRLSSTRLPGMNPVPAMSAYG